MDHLTEDKKALIRDLRQFHHAVKYNDPSPITSRAIHTLEAHYHTTLIDRNSKTSLHLTRPGQRLYNRVTHIFIVALPILFDRKKAIQPL